MCQTICNLVKYVNTGFNDNEQYFLAIFADLAKAFDLLDREKLLQ